MASITSPGVGSGLDVSGIVTQLVALERAPLQKMQATATQIQTRISSYGKVQGMIAAVDDAATTLGGSSLWGQTTATSGDAGSVGVTTTGSAAEGSYSVQVDQLAKAHGLASSAFTDSSVELGGGTLKFEFGTWDAGQTTFTANASATAVDVVIDPTASSLAEVRDQINAANAGVTAVILRDASGARLLLRSSATGEESALRISATDSLGDPLASGVGLGALAFDPPNGGTAMTQTQAAQNALVNVNGIDIVSTSNTLTEVLDGVNLTLTKATTSAVEITVSVDKAAMRSAIDSFVKAYNELNTFIAQQTRYDEASKVAGPLQGDSAAIRLRSQFRGLLGDSSTASTVFTRLTDIGFDVQKNGSIEIDATKLDAAFADLPELTKLFAADDGDSLTNTGDGFGKRFEDLADDSIGFEGTVPSRTEGLQQRLSQNQDEQDRLEERVALVQQRLLRQYTALDTQMSRIKGLFNSVSAQMASLSNNGG